MNDHYRLSTAFSKLLMRMSIVCAVAGLVPAIAHAEGTGGVPPILRDEIPDKLQVPNGQVLLFHALAASTQNYECRSDATGTTAWVFRQPKAVLRGDDGEPISAPGRDAASDVPWLLLRGTPGETDGRFAHVSYIQRLDTHGGLAPTGPCEPDLEPSLAVPYLAVYYFYAPIELAHREPAPTSGPVDIGSSQARSECWVAGDAVGDANPIQLYATLCGVSGSAPSPTRSVAGR